MEQLNICNFGATGCPAPVFQHTYTCLCSNHCYLYTHHEDNVWTKPETMDITMYNILWLKQNISSLSDLPFCPFLLVQDLYVWHRRQLLKKATIICNRYPRYHWDITPYIWIYTFCSSYVAHANLRGFILVLECTLFISTTRTGVFCLCWGLRHG